MTKIAYVQWVDAHVGSGQYDLVESVGIVILEDAERFIIVQHRFALRGNEDQVRRYEGVQFIMKANIQRMQVWETEGE